MANELKRFEAKFVKDDSGCWLWSAAKNNRGYGVIGYGGGNKIILAHRLSWMLYRGEIPSGKWLLHKCDVRACVNPDHLYLGDIFDNARDLQQRGNPYKFPARKDWPAEWENKRTESLPRGSRHHRSAAKINESIARAIFLDEGAQSDIAERYGLCQQTVSQIKTLKTWGHVNGNS